MKISRKIESGNTIVVSLLVITLLGSFIAVAVDYTSNVARNAQRDRAFNNAVEVGDGCISQAFATWRQICKTATGPTAQNPATASFAGIPSPSPSAYPSFANATISNYSVQAVDPVMSPLPNSSATPPPASGPGKGTFSYFYLASVDVTLPAITGSLTAKVRRVFEKRYTSPWNWAMMYNGDLELHPDAPLTLNGWVHSNNNVFVGNGTTDATATPTSTLTFLDRLSYQGNYTVGYDPNDGAHTGYVNTAAPITPADLPPGHEQFYSLFGWDTANFNTTDGNADNDNYHELVDKPSVAYTSGTSTDPFKDQRMYNQAYNIADASGNYGIVVNVDASNNISVGYAGVTYNSQPSGGGSAKRINWDAVIASVHPNFTIQDNREQATVRVINFDVSQLIAAGTKSWNGIIYINDTSASSSAHRAVRVLNGASIPSSGLTIVSPNPVYIQGDFNSGRTASSEPPSNTGNPDDPDAGSYTRKPASIIGDAITLLSNNWNDANSTAALAARVASNTTVNAALVAGNVPSGSNGGNYSGGGENFVRFLEDWTSKSFTYYGSMICPYASAQGTGVWGSANTYAAPQQYWYFDSTLSVDSSGNTVTVPGYVSTVAYLQQQRWYLQY
jgi:hypothetical protein